MKWLVRAQADRIWKKMTRTRLSGVALSDVIGGGDPRQVALNLIGQIDDAVALHPGMSVLDVGCGCGRIAVGLRERIGRRGRYVGIDIVPGLIAFARREISRRFAGFRFVVRRQSNPLYEWYIEPGQDGVASIREACPDGSVDLAIAVSLFTHLDYPESRDMLREIGAALAPTGRAFLTFFSLDAEAEAGIASGTSAYRFGTPSPSGLAAVEKADLPTFAVAYARPALDRLFGEAGLEIERVISGSWSGRGAGPNFQDAVVARRADG